ncbi:hypothetical protein [Streptococcus oriscaviae]|uniref:Uncharacterized protein n=1 Tax=Streptococcus oriscaviae TaxID=2781599 RepID=A0ABX7YIX9_9STRE|nr:hypothetical protein [Streptococcus oriscaviae]QUE53571.1 hypothetical protein INT76_06820 [Streptococcus oriscaviae]
MENKVDISTHAALSEYEKGKIYLAIQFLHVTNFVSLKQGEFELPNSIKETVRNNAENYNKYIERGQKIIDEFKRAMRELSDEMIASAVNPE